MVMRRKNVPGCICCDNSNNDPDYCDVCDFFNITSLDVTLPSFSDVPGLPTCSGCSGIGGTYNVTRTSATGSGFFGQIAGYISDPCPGRLGAPGCTTAVYRTLFAQAGCFGVNPSQTISVYVRLVITVQRTGFFCSTPSSVFEWRWQVVGASATSCPLTSYSVPLVYSSGSNECDTTGAVLITQ